MSHYCVAVISKEYIGENVFSLLEPFDEAKDVLIKIVQKRF